MRKRVVFILNPISGTKRRDDVEKIALATLSHDRFECDFQFTQYKGHGSELARAAVESGADIVAAVGGDGTINEVAAQLVHTDTALAVIPHGSGNGLAYHLHIPIDLEKSIQIINQQHEECIDVCKINGRYFFSIAGIGFDAKVAFDFNQDTHRGFAFYLKHILRNYFNYKPGAYAIEYDGERRNDSAFFITFANSSQWGYNVKIAPMASIQDGFVEACIVKRPKLLLKMLNVDLPLLLSSNFNHSNIVQYISCKHLKIEAKDGSAIYLHIDGDAAGIVENVEVQVVPKSLRILVPTFI